MKGSIFFIILAGISGKKKGKSKTAGFFGRAHKYGHNIKKRRGLNNGCQTLTTFCIAQKFFVLEFRVKGERSDGWVKKSSRVYSSSIQGPLFKKTK